MWLIFHILLWKYMFSQYSKRIFYHSLELKLMLSQDIMHSKIWNLKIFHNKKSLIFKWMIFKNVQNYCLRPFTFHIKPFIYLDSLDGFINSNMLDTWHCIPLLQVQGCIYTQWELAQLFIHHCTAGKNKDSIGLSILIGRGYAAPLPLYVNSRNVLELAYPQAQVPLNKINGSAHYSLPVQSFFSIS